MAVRRSSVLLFVVACAILMLASNVAFVSPPGQRALRSMELAERDLAGLAVAGASMAAVPETAHARLPEEFVIFAPIVDVLPSIPFFFLLLAFLWQASVGFR
mmetsp:Transcript_18739/g.36082  ORF Transcript_18739/g.36082 Transcript_18739/m.36082 type:complete len:102 (+) Transcript_18739:82-387(+)